MNVSMVSTHPLLHSHHLIQGACVSDSSQNRVLSISLRLEATLDTLSLLALSATSQETVRAVVSDNTGSTSL